MSKEVLKKDLLESLRDPLEAYGFVLNKGLAEFTKKQKGGWNKFQLVFLNRKAGWEIDLGMLIRKDVIENIYHQASYFDPKYHKTTPSLGIAIEKFINDGNEYRCYLNLESDIESCADYIENLFIKVALPFFEQYDNLRKMDEAVNIKSGISIFSGLKYEGNLGIILAKLVKNPDYDFFLEKYLNYYKTLANGFYLQEYEKLVKVLDTINID
jgi:hypothetical protein